ncbi:MAG TPA: S8 family serine peptidase [Candidatus Sulfotelmatobacter sp.]|jgi:subtilisin family serine protease
MKYFRWIFLLTLLAAAISPANAQTGIIVSDTLGANGLKGTCFLLNCQVSASLGDPSRQVFLVESKLPLNPTFLLTALLNQVGVVNAELDQPLRLIEQTAGPVPESLLDETPLPYYGATVWDGYANQPAAQIVGVPQAQQAFNVTGAGVVAVIDTGADTEHPALMPVLVPGYNFVDNTPSGDETGSLNQSSVALLDGTGPVYLNGTTVAMLNQSSVALLDGFGNADFGHGTMTAGIVHLVAPTAHIMPLVAFSSDGTGYLSNVIRATYYAAQNGANVISMSFSFSSPSAEMTKAIHYANRLGIVCVASAGNNGNSTVVYPAGISGVMGVASTSDLGTRSSFSNYGSDVWVAAPGEAIISTYPYGTYAAEWGTSFSAPFVSGTAALLLQVSPSVNQQAAATAIAHAVPIDGSGMGNGELNAFQAVQSWVDAQP